MKRNKSNNLHKSSLGNFVGDLHIGSLVYSSHEETRRENSVKTANIQEKQQATNIVYLNKHCLDMNL